MNSLVRPKKWFSADILNYYAFKNNPISMFFLALSSQKKMVCIYE